MTFLHYLGHWYEFDMNLFECYNFRGGWFIPDENRFGNAEIKEYSNWHELYQKEGYDPTLLSGTDRFANDVWISPIGSFHWGDGHAVMAQCIAEIWYGWERNKEFSTIGNYEDAERVLERHGWVKCSRFFWDMHLNEHVWWEMTREQAQAVELWCFAQGIEYPEDIIVKREVCWYNEN